MHVWQLITGDTGEVIFQLVANLVVHGELSLDCKQTWGSSVVLCAIAYLYLTVTQNIERTVETC